MTTAGFASARSPINDDEAETHYHKKEAYPSKTGSLEERESAWDHYGNQSCILFRHRRHIYSNTHSHKTNLQTNLSALLHLGHLLEIKYPYVISAWQ